MKIRIQPFTTEMIPAAAGLLARRHQSNRAKLPLLPARFEDEQSAAKAVRALWEKKFKYGYAAFREERLVAYLIGEHVVQPWARCGYIQLPGYALADGESEEVLQDLYARLGEDWVDNGVFSHGMYVSAADEISSRHSSTSGLAKNGWTVCSTFAGSTSHRPLTRKGSPSALPGREITTASAVSLT